MKKKEVKKQKETKEKLDLLIKWKRILLVVVSVCLVLFSGGMFLLYGPWPYVRETLITTAMTTMTHQYFATWFYGPDTIQRVLNNQKVIESGENSDPNQIQIKDPKHNSITYANEYERQILEKDPGNDLYKIIPFILTSLFSIFFNGFYPV